MILHIFILFTLCIKLFVGESFKLNYVSTKVKNILYILYSLDMNSYVQQRSFCNFNINVVIIQYASTKVKNTFYYNKLLILDMNLYVRQRSYTFFHKVFNTINLVII